MGLPDMHHVSMHHVAICRFEDLRQMLYENLGLWRTLITPDAMHVQIIRSYPPDSLLYAHCMLFHII